MKFSEMNDSECRGYVDFLLRQYRLADAYWFLAVEDTFGTQAAVNLNQSIWTRMGAVASREIEEDPSPPECLITERGFGHKLGDWEAHPEPCLTVAFSSQHAIPHCCAPEHARALEPAPLSSPPRTVALRADRWSA